MTQNGVLFVLQPVQTLRRVFGPVREVGGGQPSRGRGQHLHRADRQEGPEVRRVPAQGGAQGHHLLPHGAGAGPVPRRAQHLLLHALVPEAAPRGR